MFRRNDCLHHHEGRRVCQIKKREAVTRVTCLLDIFLYPFMVEAILSSEMMVTCTRLHSFTLKKIVIFMVTQGGPQISETKCSLSCLQQPTGLVGLVVTVLNLFREVLHLNAGRDTDYPDIFGNFTQSLQDNSGIARI
jgi:hypothetical protein